MRILATMSSCSFVLATSIAYGMDDPGSQIEAILQRKASVQPAFGRRVAYVFSWSIPGPELRTKNSRYQSMKELVDEKIAPEKMETVKGKLIMLWEKSDWITSGQIESSQEGNKKKFFQGFVGGASYSANSIGTQLYVTKSSSPESQASTHGPQDPVVYLAGLFYDDVKWGDGGISLGTKYPWQNQKDGSWLIVKPGKPLVTNRVTVKGDTIEIIKTDNASNIVVGTVAVKIDAAKSSLVSIHSTDLIIKQTVDIQISAWYDEYSEGVIIDPLDWKEIINAETGDKVVLGKSGK